MSHIIPAHKKNDKRSVNNYRPVSLLPICGKVFERIIYNNVLFLEDNKLLTPNQSGFRPNDSCINLLFSIVHSIYSDFDHNPSLEVRGNFSIFLKRLIKFGMMVFYINLNALVFLEIY